MSYHDKIAETAKLIQGVAEEISSLERKRKEWIIPKAATFYLGQHLYVTREDGTTPACLEGIKREAIKAFDDLIFSKKGQLEGLRFKLINIAKQGGAA